LIFSPVRALVLTKLYSLYQAGWTSMYIANIFMFPLIDRFGRRFFLRSCFRSFQPSSFH
jgi:hypothetical protein